MPEYLAPGVYVEETSFRSKSIEGVSTTTTGFVGPARYGPVTEPADVITSLEEFQRVHAGGSPLAFATAAAPATASELPNFLWQAARAFFAEGGKRLYVARAFRPLQGAYPPNFTVAPVDLGGGGGSPALWADGHARGIFGPVTFRSRFPGAAANLIVRLTVRAGQNIAGAERLPNPAAGGPTHRPTLGALADRDVLAVLRAAAPNAAELFIARFEASDSVAANRWRFRPLNPAGAPEVNLATLIPNPSPDPGAGDAVRVLTLAVNVLSSDREHDLGSWAGLPLDPGHLRAGAPDSVFAQFRDTPASVAEARSLPLVFADPAAGVTGLQIANAMPNLASLTAEETAAGMTLVQKLTRGVAQEIQLRGGNDGQRPGAAEYEGTADLQRTFKTGLRQLEDVEDISIIAAPGSTADYANFRDDANAIYGLLIGHAEAMRYRIAVLDSPPGQSIADVRRVRAKLDSRYAAFYYPWVTVLDPVTRAEIHLPPSGFVAGIYARNDIQRAVYKAPANEVVNLAIGFEQTLNKAQQEVLNPEGINCFRYFEGRGYRLWGARTISSDPEWKYVNLRRYFAYLERSIDKGTQWAVFEPNGEALWANVRRTIEDFLLNEWQSGALLGDKPEKAFFVKCDRSTMTQNDLDNGRIICLIGVAPLRPAEFVIFRIGQWTADRKA